MLRKIFHNRKADHLTVTDTGNGLGLPRIGHFLHVKTLNIVFWKLDSCFEYINKILSKGSHYLLPEKVYHLNITLEQFIYPGFYKRRCNKEIEHLVSKLRCLESLPSSDNITLKYITYYERIELFDDLVESIKSTKKTDLQAVLF